MAEKEVLKKFRSYPHIPNLVHMTGKIEAVLEGKDINWVAMEKIDGANIQILLTEDNCIVSSRNRVLTAADNDGFFNYLSVIQRYNDRLRNVYDELVMDYGCIGVRVFGELFGGYYPGSTLPKKHQIQKRVHYLPHPDLYVFDVRIEFENLLEDFWLSVDEVVNLCRGNNFDYFALPLKQGSFYELSQLNPVFDTKIPRYPGSEKPTEITAEGYVIKPTSGFRDLICKLKAEYAQENNLTKTPKVTLPGTFSTLEDMYFQNLAAGLTRARVKAMFSKLTVDEVKGFPVMKHAGLLLADIVEELLDDATLQVPKPEVVKLMKKKLTDDAVKLIRAELDSYCQDYCD